MDKVLEHELRVLATIEGVTGVSASAYTGTDLNRMTINLYVQRPDFNSGMQKQVITKCSRDVPNKIAAARLAQQKLGQLLGEDAVRAAVEQVAVEDGAGCGATTSTAPAPASAFAVLGETQRLQGEVRAAELRAVRELEATRAAEAAHDTAMEALAEARAALESHQKRQRTEAPEQVSCSSARHERALKY